MGFGVTDFDQELSPEDEAAFKALIEGDTTPDFGATARVPAVDPLAMQRKPSMLKGAQLAPDDLSGSLPTPQSRERDRADANMAIPEDRNKVSLSSATVDPWLRAHNAIATPAERSLLPEQAPPGFVMPPEWAQQRARAKEIDPSINVNLGSSNLYAGATEPGNLDLSNRPAVKNPNGSISSVRSISFAEVPGGPEILIPTVTHDGKVLSDDDAITYYKQTGEHLGKYPTVEAANAAGQRIHEQQAALSEPKPPASELDQHPLAQLARAQQQPAMMSAPVQSQTPAYTVPSAKEPFSTPELGLAALADLVLNRGRSVPSIIALGAQNHDTAWETQQRQMLVDKNAAEIEHLKRAGIVDPVTLMLRQQNYDLQRERLSQGATAEARRTRAQQIKEDRADPNSPQSQAARDIAARNNIPVSEDQSWDDIHSLYPSINKNLETTGALGQADVRHAAEKAGAESAATEGSRIRVAEAAAGARAQAQGDVQRDNKTETMEATRRAGEAELSDAFAGMETALKNRPSWSAAAQLVPDALGRRVLLPEQAAYNSRKDAAINAAEKMVTGGVPHADAVRQQLQNLPEYWTPGAEESLRHIRESFQSLGEAGFAGIEQVKRQAPTVRDRAPKASKPPAHAPVAHAVGGVLLLPDGSKAQDTPENRQKLTANGIGVQ